MRGVYKNLPRFKAQAKKLQKWIRKNFTEEDQHAEFMSCINKLFPDPEEVAAQKDMKFSKLLELV